MSSEQHAGNKRLPTLNERVAIRDRERVAKSAEEHASLIDVLTHGAHLLLEHSDSNEFISAMAKDLGKEVTEDTIHEARALGTELAQRERGIAEAAASGADLILQFGLPN